MLWVRPGGVFAHFARSHCVAHATPALCTDEVGKQVRCTCMIKKPFTTRIDEQVLAVAQQLADNERRSVTSLIEIAVLEYAARHQAPPPSQDEIQVLQPDPPARAGNLAVRATASRTKKPDVSQAPAARTRASRTGPTDNR